MGKKEDTPAWFQNCIDNLTYEDCFVKVTSDVDGTCANIHYQLFPPPSPPSMPSKYSCKRPIVLVHGGGAHSRWWDWTAPFLAKDGHLVASIDMSGQGDSDTRNFYSLSTNALEVMSVARVIGQQSHLKPIIIGHSFGGWVTLLCGKIYGNELGGIVVLDSAVRPATHPDNRRGPPMRKKKMGTRTELELKKRFRLMPPQPVQNSYLLDYIFPLSIRKEKTTATNGEDEYIYVWKDDPLRYKKHSDFSHNFTEKEWNEMSKESSQMLRNLQCRLTFCYGEYSVFFNDPSILQHIRNELDHYPPKGQLYTPIIKIPNSHHHVMFDQPQLTTCMLQTILQQWHASDIGKNELIVSSKL